MAEAKQTVQKYIDDNNVIVFSKSYCPFCQQTKQALERINAEFTTIELDKRDDGQALQDALQEISGQRTVPNVWIAQKHIGGNSDLQEKLKSGELQTLLSNAGALKA